MPAWEYRVSVVAATAEASVEFLEDEGAEGWELASVVQDSGDPAKLLLFLKRERADSVSAEASQEAEAPREEDEEAADVASPQDDSEELASPPAFRVVLTDITADDTPAFILRLTQTCEWIHLRDAKRLVESLPAELASGLAEEEAMALLDRLIEIGAVADAHEV